MKIQGRDLGMLSNTTESLQSRSIAPQAPEVAPAEDMQTVSEEVSISQTSLEYSKAAEMMERESPERAERIRTIQKEIENGTYRVDAAKIADKMLQELLSE
jgi:flagellar biosynthesis anti-sigma factor FlgM